MPKIAIDYTPAYEQGGGIGRYVRELTSALSAIDTDNSYHLFVSGAHPTQLGNLPSTNFTWHATTISPKWLARIWHRAQLPIPVELFTGQINLFHVKIFTRCSVSISIILRYLQQGNVI